MEMVNVVKPQTIVTPQQIGNYYLPSSCSLIAPIFTQPIPYQQFQPSMVLAYQNQLQSMMNVNYWEQQCMQLQQVQYYQFQPFQVGASQLQPLQVAAS